VTFDTVIAGWLYQVPACRQGVYCEVSGCCLAVLSDQVPFL